VRKFLTWVSGPVLAVFFLWLCFRGVEPGALVARLATADLVLLAVAVASVPLHLVLRTVRWRTLLASEADTASFTERLSAVSIGYMATLLPGRVGEVLRPALLSRRTGVAFGRSLATVGVERVVLDLIAVMLFGAVGLLLPRTLSGLAAADPEVLASLQLFGGLLLAGALASFGVVAWMARHRPRLSARLTKLADGSPRRLVRRLAAMIGSLLPGLDAFATWRGMLRLTGETLLIWAVITAGIHAGIVACGVELAPGSSAIMLPILAFGIAIPTPGGTGGYHFAMKAGLVALFGAPEAAALGAGLVVHALTWLPILAMGALYVARGGLVREAKPVGEMAS
jgi:hypothetical protein